MTNVVNLTLEDVALVSIDMLPAKPTAQDRQNFRAALVKTAQTLTGQIRAGKDAIASIRDDINGGRATQRESRSGLLVRTFLTAIMGGELNAVETALGKGADKKTAPGPWTSWQAAKAMSSQATFLNQFLARNVVNVPEGKDGFIIGGNPVSGPITAAHKTALTAPSPSDTGIGTIIKYARAQGKAVTAKVEAAAKAEDAALDAFFAEHRADMLKLGADASTVRDLVQLDTWSGPTLTDMIEEGRTLIEAQAEADASEAQAADDAAMVDRVVAMVPGLSPEALDALIVAIERRKADEAAADLVDHAEGTTSTEKRRKRA